MKPIEKMTFKELTALSVRVDKALAAARVQEANKIRAEAEKLAAASGITLADLFGKKHAKKPRIVNPANKAQSYGGYGPKPKWLTELKGGNQ